VFQKTFFNLAILFGPELPNGVIGTAKRMKERGSKKQTGRQKKQENEENEGLAG